MGELEPYVFSYLLDTNIVLCLYEGLCSAIVGIQGHHTSKVLKLVMGTQSHLTESRMRVSY